MIHDTRIDSIPHKTCQVCLIFLRRVGGGYIFIQRLLPEQIAEMCVETPD